MPNQTLAPELAAEKDGADLRVRVGGDWSLQAARPDSAPVFALLDQQRSGALVFDTAQLGRWDSSLLVFLLQCQEHAATQKVEFRTDTLPDGIAALLTLSEAVPEQQTGKGNAHPDTWLERLGKWSLAGWKDAREFVEIVGESVLSLLRLARRRGTFNWRDFRITLQETSAGALPITALISFLMGLILAFVGATQLEKFGASIYVPNLVGLGMVREMGPLMTAIIMAGRTGAAFAAQLGSMKVSEEIDALKTLAISPQDFLVTPRLIALFIMMPLLCLYADLIGIVGGAVVGLQIGNLSAVQFINQTQSAVALADIGTGLSKSVAFGGIVALTGCLRGMQCGSDASAVGIAATSAVVTGITLIVVADAVFDVIFNLLKL